MLIVQGVGGWFRCCGLRCRAQASSLVEAAGRSTPACLAAGGHWARFHIRPLLRLRPESIEAPTITTAAAATAAHPRQKGSRPRKALWKGREAGWGPVCMHDDGDGRGAGDQGQGKASRRPERSIQAAPSPLDSRACACG